ncbi:MAG: 3'-5' exonuclease [Limnoraphis sp.]
MALMIPEAAPSTASQGEKRLFKVLRDELPDDFFIYYEPNVKGLYPDFIILSPDFGILILEVKGWSANQILKADHQIFEVCTDGRVEKCQSPLRQGKGYLDALMNKLKDYSILTQDEGEYQGKLAFPMGVGVVMTNMTEAEATDENIYPLLEKSQTAYKDELEEWNGIGERELIKRLESMFTVRFKFWGLEDDQISTIKGVIHPEVQVKLEPATLTSVHQAITPKPNATIIKTLDHKQEQLARSLGSGHRLFCGVAGSGKTLILLSRAKTLAGGVFNQKVLILCFNITLAAYLRSLIEEENNPLYQERIEVLHFHDWAKSILGSLPNPKNYESNEYDEIIGDRLLEVLALMPPGGKWDSLLVDEAHTFYPAWFKCCAAALKDPENGDLLIVSDKSQSLYQRQKFTWKSVGIKAQGRVRKLNRNYRNTSEILSAAWDMVQSLSTEDEDDDEAFPLVKPEAALRHGKKPVLHLVADRMAEVENAIAQIQQLVSEGYESKDIAVIYRYLARCEAEPFGYLTQQLDELGLGCYWVNQNKKNYSRHHPGIRLITSKSALGLEFKAVIIPWVQQFGVGDEAEGKRELYVSMTRAQEILHLFGSGRFDFLKGLQECQHFDVA